MRWRRSIPVLRIFSVDMAEEFYLGFMGFAVDWRHRFEPGTPLYMQVSRDGLVLHLSEHHGDACPGATIFIEIAGIHALREELIARNYAYARPAVQEQPWGYDEMTIADPFGNRLRFAERREPAPD